MGIFSQFSKAMIAENFNKQDWSRTRRIQVRRYSSLLIALSALACGLSSCATTPNRKTLQWMAGAGLAGAVVGTTRQEFKTENAVLYGSVAAATAAVVGLLLNSSDREIDTLRSENISLSSKLKDLELKYQPKLIQEGSSLASTPLPKDISGLVRPGSWRRYSLDQWVQDEANPNIWYRQKEMFEFIPPQTAN